MPKLTFHGAARTVTGSRFLLEGRGFRLLVDCGLFQGPAEIRNRNREPFPVDPPSLDAVLLTHAHVDHSGFLPRLRRDGFTGPVFCSPPTAALAGLLLPDSARLQEEDTRFRRKNRFEEELEPLYSEADAKEVLKQFVTVRFGVWEEIRPGLRIRLHRAGHILGAAFIEVAFKSGGARHQVVFSGDLGRYDVPILVDPEPLPGCDLLVLESTYGNRLHDPEGSRETLARSLQAALRRNGIVLIPAFAVGRAQEVLYELSVLMDEKRIPELPVFVDSPMARSATHFYRQFRSEHDLDLEALEESGRNPFERRNVRFVKAREDSKALNRESGPAIILSASGMASGGRILHHLRRRLSDPSCSVLFVGYQAMGTLGRQLVEGSPSVSIFGEEIGVEAHVSQISSFSAHADLGDLMRWTASGETPPSAVALVHGEPEAQDALSEKLASERGWVVAVPNHGDSIDL